MKLENLFLDSRQIYYSRQKTR